MKNTIFSLATLVAFCFLNTAVAGASDCKNINSSSKRLACFDEEIKRSDLAEKKRDESAKLREEEVQRVDAEKAKKADDAAKERVKSEMYEHDKKIILEITRAAKNAIRSLKKIENRVKIGVSYRDYPAVLSEAVDAVREFQDSKNSDLYPMVSFALSKSLGHYKMALIVWQEKFQNRTARDDVVIMDSSIRLINKLREDYPNIDEAIYIDNGLMGATKRFVYSVALSLIWAEASKSVAGASRSIEAIDLPDPPR